MNKNKGLTTLQKIALVLEGGKHNEPNEYIKKLSPIQFETFKYAPTVSCDLERSFSEWRILEDCRRSFVFENLQKHVIIYCNKFN